MAFTLGEVIDRVFRFSVYFNCRGTFSGSTRGITKYLEIPVNKPVFEIPVFALNSFRRCAWETDAIVVELYTEGRTPVYKTVDRYMRDLLITDFNRYRLVKCEVQNTVYYASYGAIYNSDLLPIAMCSWEIEKLEGEERPNYRFIRPILRVHPDCLVNQSDSILKFIGRKLVTVTLGMHRFTDPIQSSSLPVRIIVEECPFRLKSVATPGIDITDKVLLSCAREHITEIIS